MEEGSYVKINIGQKSTVVAISTFDKIATGEMPIEDLHDWREITRALIGEWLADLQFKAIEMKLDAPTIH